MSETEELLGRLRELDPKTWDALYSAWRCTTSEEYRSYGWPLMIRELVRDQPSYLRDILQGVIQDAIAEINENGEGREWEFSIVATQMSYGPLYNASIWSNCGGELWEGEARTPAEAILAAYIAVLEAMG